MTIKGDTVELLKLLLFIPACFALNMAPGPNNLMAMNNARCHGFKLTLMAGLGRILAFTFMIVLAASGLAVVLYTSEVIFMMIKFLGVAYLLWLAICLWKADTSPLTDVVNTKSHVGLAKQEFILAIGNPKAILIFTAFLPQFIDVSANIKEQFIVLGVVFLALEILAISIYAMFGIYLRRWFTKPQTAKRFNRVCAGFLATSSVNLLLARKD